MGRIVWLIKALLTSFGSRHEANTEKANQPKADKTEEAADLGSIGIQLTMELRLMLRQTEWSKGRFGTRMRVHNHETSVHIDDDEHEFQTLVEVIIDTAGRYTLPPLHLVVYPTEHEVKSIGRFGTSPDELAKLVDRIHSYLWAYVHNI